MSRTTDPPSAADEPLEALDGTPGDQTPPGGIDRATIDGAARDGGFRLVDDPTLVEPPEPVVVAEDTAVAPAAVDPDPKRSLREAWGTRETIQTVATVIVLVGVTVFTFVQLHPSRIFSAAVPTGGDMGAHVWAPAYLRDHLLPHGRVIGWSMDWYAGLPVYRFYMLPPALLILALDTVMSYGMAFKIVAVLGVLTLPLCSWAFGRLGRFPFPIPALFAVASTIFLFDETFTILGGNIASTMAGEFSFSIALSLAMLGLGVFARGMENGRYRPLAAILIALAALTHGIVVFFVAIGVLVLFLISADRHRFVYFITTSVTALALSAFWIVPFVLTSRYMTDMKYEGAPTPGGQWNSYWRMFFPHLTIVDQFWTVLAIVGFVAAVIRRHRAGAFLGVYALVLTALVFLSKSGIPGFGLLWNVRLLPFLYLLRYMLAMVGIIEIVWFLVRAVRNARLARLVDTAGPKLPIAAVYVRGASPRDLSRRKLLASVLTLGAVSIVSVGWLSWHLGKFPGQNEVYNAEGQTDADKYRYEWLGIDVSSSQNNGFVDGWADWNFQGWVGKPAYGEYRDLIETMKRIGADPAHGCGRALWEEPNGGEYGTPMALMLLPFWTDSCIGSMEGLYFEASATTPYNFLARAALSQEASNPVRGLSYEDRDAAKGVRYLQELGVRYYLAWTPEAVERAAAQPELIEIATSGPWHIYEVASSDLVVPLTVEPVVVEERSGDQRERWLEVGASWFQHPELWDARPAADGPESWQRVTVEAEEQLDHPKVDLVAPVEEIETRPLPEVTVSDIRLGNESISFSVDQIGVPVVVKVSWFPNWDASGADGPYRIAPNLMVVIPTEHEVQLSYGFSAIDYTAYGLTFLGVIGLFVMWRRGPVVYPGRAQPWAAYPPDPDPFAPERSQDLFVAEPVDAEEGPELDALDLALLGAGSGVDGDQAAEADELAEWARGEERVPEAAMLPEVPADEPETGFAGQQLTFADLPPEGPAVDPVTGWPLPTGVPLSAPPGAEFWADGSDPDGEPRPEFDELAAADEVPPADGAPLAEREQPTTDENGG